MGIFKNMNDVHARSRKKIVVISHALILTFNQRRWRLLAEDKNFEVHLIVPKRWKTCWFGDTELHDGDEIHEENFHVHALATTHESNWGRYLFKSIDMMFRDIKPDVIYIVHEEGILVHQQVYLCRKLFSPASKIIFFSMNAMGIPGVANQNFVKRMVSKLMWRNVKRNTEAALVHYPGCVDSLRSGGYTKPIFIQTQVGVDETVFRRDERLRESYRDSIELGDRFIIGYAGRLTVDKGVDDLLSAFIKLAKRTPNTALLLVGDGDFRQEIENSVREDGLENRVHITGFVSQADVPGYLNAMDTFVLASKTTSHWLDTFPLVTVQAQSSRIPVIASNSASIPWQLGETARIFPEGNREELQACLQEFIESKQLREFYAEKGVSRSHEYFCHIGMTLSFKKILDQVIFKEYKYHGAHENYVQWKAY